MNRFENGLDSLRKALNVFFKSKKTNSDYKDELIFFHNAVEVLFKHLLYEIHPILLYTDTEKTVDKAFDRMLEGQDLFKNVSEKLDYDKESKQKTQKLKNCQKNQQQNTTEEKLHTVEFAEAIKRVSVVYDLVITNNVYQSFIRLNELRNAITHDELDFQRTESEQTIIDLLPTVIDIFERKLDGEFKRRFDSVISTKKSKINGIYRDNYVNAINSFLSLLSIYSDKGYDEFTEKEKEKLVKTAELYYGKIKGNYNDLFFEIDKEYYITIKTFLSQKICEYIVDKSEFEIFKTSTKLKSVCVNNPVLYDVLKKYAYVIITDITQLGLDDIDFLSDVETVRNQVTNHLDKETFIINLYDIYVDVLQLKKIIERIEWTKPTKGGGRTKFENDNTLLDNDITISDFIKFFEKWFKENGWKSINGAFEGITEKDQTIIMTLKGYPYDVLILKGDADELIGQESDIGTIDRLDDETAEFCELNILIKEDEKNYKAIVTVMVNTETYFDDAFIPGGKENLLFLLSGEYDNDVFTVKETRYLDVIHKPRFEKYMITA